MTTQQSEAVLQHHLEALGAWNPDEILADYAEDAILFTPLGTIKGVSAIEEFFGGMKDVIVKIMAEVELVRQDVDGEIAYIVYTAGDAVPLGTDTFVVKNGKIVVQTFAAYMP